MRCKSQGELRRLRFWQPVFLLPDAYPLLFSPSLEDNFGRTGQDEETATRDFECDQPQAVPCS